MKSYENLRILLDANKYKSLTKVAYIYKLEISTVSRRIKKIEEEIGYQIFARSTAGLKTTPKGNVFLKQVHTSVDILNKAYNSASTFKEVHFIKISAPEILGAYLISPIVAEYLKQHNDIFIELNCSNKLHDIDNYDIFIRITSQPNPNLIAQRLTSQESNAVCSPQFIDNEAINTIEDLSKAKYCKRTDLSHNQYWHCQSKDNKEKSLAFLMQNPVVKSNSLICAKNLALNGLAVAMLPSWYVKHEINAGTLINIFPQKIFNLNDNTECMYIMYSREFSQESVHKKVIDYIINNFSTNYR